MLKHVHTLHKCTYIVHVLTYHQKVHPGLDSLLQGINQKGHHHKILQKAKTKQMQMTLRLAFLFTLRSKEVHMNNFPTINKYTFSHQFFKDLNKFYHFQSITIYNFQNMQRSDIVNLEQLKKFTQIKIMSIFQYKNLTQQSL